MQEFILIPLSHKAKARVMQNPIPKIRLTQYTPYPNKHHVCVNLITFKRHQFAQPKGSKAGCSTCKPQSTLLYSLETPRFGYLQFARNSSRNHSLGPPMVFSAVHSELPSVRNHDHLDIGQAGIALDHLLLTKDLVDLRLHLLRCVIHEDGRGRVGRAHLCPALHQSEQATANHYIVH